MSDWQVGDLAVRVDCECGGGHSRSSTGLKLGAVYRVVGVRPGPFLRCRAPCALILAEDHTPTAYLGICSVTFRKIRPDEHEACEPEFVTLLRRSKVSA
jgi:hypothetical protein